MAERSKALDSSSSLFGGVGSNPTPSSLIFFFFLVARFPRWALIEVWEVEAWGIGLVV